MFLRGLCFTFILCGQTFKELWLSVLQKLYQVITEHLIFLTFIILNFNYTFNDKLFKTEIVLYYIQYPTKVRRFCIDLFWQSDKRLYFSCTTRICTVLFYLTGLPSICHVPYATLLYPSLFIFKFFYNVLICITV